jgi:hypothetical protein
VRAPLNPKFTSALGLAGSAGVDGFVSGDGDRIVMVCRG